MDTYMYPNEYICIEGEKGMSGFGKKCYTKPVICQHHNDLSKDWYVFFRFKNEVRFTATNGGRISTE
jgi:hypothetical protein